ncbi:unnamed protein product [Brassicogethes aeneus]|uniref:Uncharacterized protein n=1 Tax=Brassicogethes aeneus TaxID=1431903 RepID=A0A9P0FFJ5_BRAAE|nr:unnamed protein product [Brassicogethes aeneus]
MCSKLIENIYDQSILNEKSAFLTEDVEKIANRTLSEISNSHKYVKECQKTINLKDEEIWRVPNPKNKVMHEVNVNHLIIQDIPVFNKGNNGKKRETLVSRKYFIKWRNIVKGRKNLSVLKEQQAKEKQKLDKLIENILKTKPKIMDEKVVKNKTKKIKKPNEPSCIKNRYKAQHDIIKMQKNKIEQQDKIIKELKLGIIREDLEKSVGNTNVDIHEIFHMCSKNLKLKMPHLQKVDEREKIMVNSQKAPKLVHEMEKRAMERSMKRELILERKRIIEEERQRLLEEMLEKKAAIEEEQLKKNLEAIKERRKKELELEKIRQFNKTIFLEKYEKAVKFYNGRIKNKCFKILYDDFRECKRKYSMAEIFYERKILKIAFNSWIFFIEDKYKMKYNIAEAMFAYKTYRKYLDLWHKYCIEIRFNMQTAEDYCDFRLTSNVFSQWRNVAYNQIILREKRMKLAEVHYNK